RDGSGAAWHGLRACMLALLAERGPGRSLCPSEVARAWSARHGGRWQDLMPLVRAMAQALCAEGVVEAMQHEAVVVLHEVRGPVRLRLCRAAQRATVA